MKIETFTNADPTPCSSAFETGSWQMLTSGPHNSPIVCVVLALDSWNYYSGEQA